MKKEENVKATGRKVLIVDDNAEFAGMVARFLGYHGFRASTAQSGVQAIEKVSSDLPDLVLLDLKLPDVSGMEVLKRIQEINEETAVVVITGYGGEQIAVDFMKAGALDFLSKPIDNDVLLRTIKNTLKIHDAEVEDRRFQRYSSLEQFFPFLAHEIRNPLHAIGGALAIIQRRSDLKDQVLAQSIRIIQEEIQHLNEFVQECLDFVRPPSKSHFIEVDVNEVILIVLNIVSYMHEETSKKIKIATDLDPQLPKIQANYEEVKQALLNVLKNAFEALSGGGEIAVKTSLKSDPAPGWVEILVLDNGPGIKHETMKHLFSPFFTTKPRGTGLGLAICQRIITERHKGKLDIDSTEGKGTTVRVELPLCNPMELG